MAAVPDKDSPLDREPESPQWLGSVARRGLAQAHGEGWKELDVEEEEGPKWLGSVARREGTRNAEGGWVEAVETEEAERPMWLGSLARRGGAARSLVVIDTESTSKEEAPETTAETTTEPTDTAPGLKKILEPSAPTDELEERREAQETPGELGLHLRKAS